MAGRRTLSSSVSRGALFSKLPGMNDFNLGSFSPDCPIFDMHLGAHAILNHLVIKGGQVKFLAQFSFRVSARFANLHLPNLIVWGLRWPHNIAVDPSFDIVLGCRCLLRDDRFKALECAMPDTD